MTQVLVAALDNVIGRPAAWAAVTPGIMALGHERLHRHVTAVVEQPHRIAVFDAARLGVHRVDLQGLLNLHRMKRPGSRNAGYARSCDRDRSNA